MTTNDMFKKIYQELKESEGRARWQLILKTYYF